jgi:hypothetical protein
LTLERLKVAEIEVKVLTRKARSTEIEVKAWRFDRLRVRRSILTCRLERLGVAEIKVKAWIPERLVVAEIEAKALILERLGVRRSRLRHVFSKGSGCGDRG